MIKDYNTPSIYGVGYYGIGEFRSRFEGKQTKEYVSWICMLRRCYSKDALNRNNTYINSAVCTEWHNFQNFAKWFTENYNPETMQGWHLDKDILIKGNKVYSPDTCCFVPQDVNKIFTKSNNKRGFYPIGVTYDISNSKYLARLNKNGKLIFIKRSESKAEAFQAYKAEKEKYIKEVADRWKGLISDRVYEALLNYKVEIID